MREDKVTSFVEESYRALAGVEGALQRGSLHPTPRRTKDSLEDALQAMITCAGPLGFPGLATAGRVGAKLLTDIDRGDLAGRLDDLLLAFVEVLRQMLWNARYLGSDALDPHTPMRVAVMQMLHEMEQEPEPVAVGVDPDRKIVRQ